MAKAPESLGFASDRAAGAPRIGATVSRADQPTTAGWQCPYDVANGNTGFRTQRRSVELTMKIRFPS
jgi:hypothetical protein